MLRTRESTRDLLGRKLSGGRLLSSTLSFLVITVLFLLTLTQAALAQTAAPGGQQPSAFASLLPMAVMFGILWFLVFRPQMRKQKQHQEFLGKLQRGDEVLTSGGVLGRIEGLTDQFVTLEIAQGVRIRVLRSAVAAPLQPVKGQEAKA